MMLKSTYEYSKPRRAFGREPLFQIVNAHMLDSIYPNKAHQKEYMLRNPVHHEVQATLPQSEHDANTAPLVIRDSGIKHSEGGWPKDVHPENEEHVSRYARRVTHEDHYVNAIAATAPAMRHCLDQNNAIDMYTIYFSNLNPQKTVEKPCILIANSFRDRYQRTVSSMDWTCETNTKVVASYYNSTESTDPLARCCKVWDIQNQNQVLNRLIPSHPCWKLACSPVEPDIVLCGLENGTVCIFDLRTDSEPILSSSVYNSHLDSITGLLYTQNRTNTEFYTGSPDGQCMWWDIRDLSEPVERLPMSVQLKPNEKPSLSNAEGISAIEFDKSVPTKFLCGTESGYVINGNRMGKSHSEILSSYFKAHHGPVRKVQRSPCTFRMFLTCSTWEVRVWSEEVRTAPIIVTKQYKHEVTDAAWATARFSCYMSVCTDGMFHYWDFLRKYKEAVVSLKLTNHALTTVVPQADGELVIVGDDNGTIYLLQLSENMAYPDPHNKSLMAKTYERETRREHILDNRIKEIHLKKREEEAAALGATESAEEEMVEEEDPDKAVEEAYFEIVKEELRNMYGTSGMSDLSIPEHA